MKRKIKEYAIALGKVILEDKRGEKEIKKIADNFIRLLIRDRQLKNIRKILDLTEDLILRQKGNKKVLIETARELNPSLKRNLLKSLLKDGDLLREKINCQLGAGVRVTIDGKKQLDLSLDRKIRELFVNIN